MIVGLQVHDGAFRMEYRSDGGSLEEGSHNTRRAGGPGPADLPNPDMYMRQVGWLP
jgi:hypothetical protein